MSRVANSFPVALGNGREVFTFDIGGTSFRSGVLDLSGRLTNVKRIPSINHRSAPGRSAADILDDIASYIAATIKMSTATSGIKRSRPAIAISMGAALNAHTGTILGSGPILGEESSRFDLQSAIRCYFDDASITIVNDVTASLIAHSRLSAFRHARRLALITVSTGIASRVLNCSVPHVPVDAGMGTQGEIGHHRIAFSVEGCPLSLKCGCGGIGHMNAFVSGEGIRHVLAYVRETFPWEFLSLHSEPESGINLDTFAEGLANRDPLSKRLMQAFTLPIAESIKWHVMLDPEIDKLILTGGVCFKLQDYYLSSVLENLKALDFYPLDRNADTFWANRITLGPISDDAGLIGAAYMAREAPTLHRRETMNAEPPYCVSRHTATEYPVHVVINVFGNEKFPHHLLERFDRIILAIDEHVNKTYGDAIRRLLAGSYRRLETIVVAAGEKKKDLVSVTELVSAFESLSVCRRNDLIVAAGGGVISDIVGFASSIFRRGVPCLRLPTTLVGQIDAGVGIKNAVNFHEHKSRLGTFCPPYAVIVDPGFLSSLPERQIRNGLSEALKIALVADAPLFDLIETYSSLLLRSKLQCPQGSELIRRSIRAILLELSPNLYERILDRLPDYGHTFSPIFEFKFNDLEHGEAVALDMAIATGLAVVMGLLDLSRADRILATQHAMGLPIFLENLTVEILKEGIHEAMRHRGGQLRMPILTGIGEATFVDEVSESQLRDALVFVRSWSNQIVSEVSKSA